MSNPLLQKTFLAGAAIPAFRVVKLSAADTVILSTGATDTMLFVNDDVAPAAAERTDVVVCGMCFVEAGAAFALGARLTSDATGRVVTAVAKPEVFASPNSRWPAEDASPTG